MRRNTPVLRISVPLAAWLLAGGILPAQTPAYLSGMRQAEAAFPEAAASLLRYGAWALLLAALLLCAAAWRKHGPAARQLLRKVSR